MALYLEELQETLKRGCGSPNCTHNHSELYLHGKCHPKAGVDVRVDKGSDELKVFCRVCKRLIVEVKIASREGTAFPI